MGRTLAVCSLHVALSLFMFLSSPMCACSPTRPLHPADEALLLAAAVLRGSERLYSSRVGYEGATPTEVLAWRAIATSRAADSVFRTVLRTGGPTGQLYALIWLRDRDPVGFQRAAATLRHEAREVEAQQGCIVYRAPIAMILDAIERGDWTRDLWSEPARR